MLDLSQMIEDTLMDLMGKLIKELVRKGCSDERRRLVAIQIAETWADIVSVRAEIKAQ
jgi:hypothetical protein